MLQNEIKYITWDNKSDFGNWLSTTLENVSEELVFVQCNDNIDFSDEIKARMYAEIIKSIHTVFVIYGDFDFLLIKKDIPLFVSEIPSGNVYECITEWSKSCAVCGYGTEYIEERICFTNYIKDSILIDLHILTEQKNGTFIQLLGCLEGIYNNTLNKDNIYVWCKKEIATYYDLENMYKCNFVYEDCLKHDYEIAFFPYHCYLIDYMYQARKHSKLLVAWPMDIIIIRCSQFWSAVLDKTIEMLFKQSDGLVYFLESTKKDIDEYYGITKQKKTRIINLPAPIKEHGIEDDFEIPFSNYILVMGNPSPHKCINRTIDIIKHRSEKYVVVGADKEGLIASNIYSYKGGTLSSAFIHSLYENSRFVMYPSIYEGFGLPVIEALNYGKDVIVADTETNHELETLCNEFKGHIHYLEDWNQLDVLIKKASDQKLKLRKNAYDKTWDDIGGELLDFFEELKKDFSGKYIDGKKRKDLEVFYNQFENVRLVSSRNSILVKLNECDIAGQFKGKNIVIYGIGNVGRIFFNKIKNIANVKTLIDKNNNYKCLDGNIIIGPAEYHHVKGDKVIITPEFYYDEIYNMLVEEIHVNCEDIFRITETFEK